MPIPLPPEIYRGLTINRNIVRNTGLNLPIGKCKIAFLGATRYNKGFDLFVKMVDLLVTDKDVQNKVGIVSQIDITSQPNSERVVIEQAANKLRDLSVRFEQIKIIEGTLSPQQYYEFLNQIDIVVLPYRNETFNIVPSNIFRETVACGKVPVIPQRTSMVDELPVTLNDLIFDYADPIDLVRTVKHIVLNYEKYQDQIRSIQPKWIEFHNADKLTDFLLTIN